MNIAQGRLDYGPPVAVIDIGSNSVRLVAYEGLTRSPTPIFNEKVLAGLGREVQTTGLLAADAVEKALAALRRFRALCDRMDFVCRETSCPEIAADLGVARNTGAGAVGGEAYAVIAALNVVADHFAG